MRIVETEISREGSRIKIVLDNGRCYLFEATELEELAEFANIHFLK